MSTNGLTDWAVDLANVAAVYPFQGWEVAMTVVGVAFWLGWHRIQFVRENAHLKEAEKLGDAEQIARTLERY